MGWGYGVKLKSLSGSGAIYLGAAIRDCAVDQLRIHIPVKNEHTFNVTPALAAWVGKRDHSYASWTGTKYVPCLIRVDGIYIRIQIPGPKFNREWGVEFTHSVGTTATLETNVSQGPSFAYV